MPRYYFHIRRGDVFEDKDPDGEDLFDLEDAHAEALQVARDYWEDWGPLDTGTVIDVVDEAGRTVLTVPISEAIDPGTRR
jgi:hypothetical protein